jgi:hypothetical protein
MAARLPDETTWPVRVALRVRPGSVQQLEILGEERTILPVAPEGLEPIDLELATSVYRPTTAAIYISWGSMAPIAESAPSAAPESPVFVSPTEVPKATTGPTPELPAAGASEIVKPAEVAPAQPSPPGN